MSETAVRLYKAGSTVVLLCQLSRHARVIHSWRTTATLEVVVGQGSAFVNGQKIEALGFTLITPGRDVALQGLEDGTAVLLVLQEGDLAPELRGRFGGRAFAGRWRETLDLDMDDGFEVTEGILAALIDEAVEHDRAYEQRVGLA